MEAESIVSIQRKIDALKVENIEIEQKRSEIMKVLEVSIFFEAMRDLILILPIKGQNE